MHTRPDIDAELAYWKTRLNEDTFQVVGATVSDLEKCLKIGYDAYLLHHRHDFDEIAPVMYDAILSSEDKDYFSHGGVNVGAERQQGHVVRLKDRRRGRRLVENGRAEELAGAVPQWFHRDSPFYVTVPASVSP